MEDVQEGQLAELIVRSLEQQGFVIEGDRILPPVGLDKDRVRRLHAEATRHRVERSKPGLIRHERRLLERIASGAGVAPDRIAPRLIEVQPDSEEELLFRYASLHWSIPVSSGYGRRLRFLVVDQQNDKLIGLLGLGDPVFNLAARDQWIGWNKATRERNLHHVMDAFVLGAVPPYSFLLCGKLVALLAACNEVREAFSRKYAGRASLIRERRLEGRLALVTTTSALGRSSLYNRITYAGRAVYRSVGFTQGSGEFHFSNGLYAAISEFAARECQPTAKNEKWGAGFRSRREIVRKSLARLGLSSEWIYHGIQREVFVVPLAENSRAFLRGEETDLRPYSQPAEQIFSWFKERWLLPRAGRDRSYRQFDPASYGLWQGGG